MKRDGYWDTLKFMLIILVVYGHVIMPEYQKNSHENMAIFNFIFASVSLLLLFLLCGLYVYTDKSLSVMHHCNTPYYAKPVINRLIFRTIFIVLSIACSIMVLRIVKSVPRFAMWGRSTKEVYLYHFILIDFLYVLIRKGIVPNIEFMHPLYAVFIVGVLIWFSQYKIANTIINPTKLIIKNSNEVKKGTDSVDIGSCT